MSSGNSQIVHNKLASQYLCRVLDWRKWDDFKLAQVSGILPSVICAHLSGQRPIRPQYLAAYLRILDRQERSALLDAWLQDNVNREAVANLLDGTKTDGMRSAEENRSRMLDWWAAAITRDFKIAKIFRRFNAKGAFKVPLELLSLVSITSVQFQSWLLEKAYSLFTRVKHAGIAFVTLLLALCQPGKVTQQAGELAQQSGELAEKSIANSLFATAMVAPALAKTTNFNFDLKDPSPPVASRTSRSPSRDIVKDRSRPSHSQDQVPPAFSIQRTIGHQWRRLVTARKNVHSAFGRLIRDAHSRQFKQTHRKQRAASTKSRQEKLAFASLGR